MSPVEIQHIDNPKTWRLLKQSKSDDGSMVMEEMVFAVHGIVCNVDLPPVLEKPS